MTHSWEKRNLKLQCQKSSVQSELGDDDDDDDTFMKGKHLGHRSGKTK